MIAKGTTHNNGVKLAAYMTKAKPGERTELWQLRGFASDNIKDAFRSVHVIAAATQCEKPFFHVQVRNPDGEILTREQWGRVANRIETKLGYTGQPRAIAFHRDEKTGHEHMHIAWSRINAASMTAEPLPFFKLRLKEVCRELEVELGLRQVKNHRDTPVLAPTRDEFEQARRLGIDIHQVRATIREFWDRSDNGNSFAAALAAAGLTLAKGEHRDFIVIDREGGMHALGKRILGSTAAEVRARCCDLDREGLPTVEQARQQLATTRAVLRETAMHAGGPAWEDALVKAASDKKRIERRFVEAELLTPAKKLELDAEMTLEALTRNRATFTARDIVWQLREQVGNRQELSEFTAEILSHPNVVRLTGPGSAQPRYTTRKVLETEHQVLRAATALSVATGHEVSERDRATVLAREFHDITVEQSAAIRHATEAEGIALIDGQAGTGKSYTINAIRRAYEQQGRSTVGLAPTNAVAQDMRDEGFAHARTIHSELFALKSGRTQWNSRTVVIVDEAAMIDTRNLSMLTAHAQAAGAKLVLVGDDRQLSSIERGGMFSVLKDTHGAAELTQVRRQQNHGDQQASALMAQGNFRDALTLYDEKGAIHWTRTQAEARAALVDQWARDSAANPTKSRFVFAYCNQDANELNAALRDVRVRRGELGEGRTFQTKHGEAEFAPGDRLQFTETDKRRGIYNGQAATVQAIEGNTVTATLDGRDRRVVRFDAAEFDGFRHGYAGTIYKGQGRTFDQTYLYHSEHWRSAASYVALTRHREKVGLFVARETATDLGELARQVARVDERRAASHFQQPLLKRASEEVLQETDWRRLRTDPDYRRQIAQLQGRERSTTHRERGWRER